MEIIDTECVLKSCLHFLLCVPFEIRRIEFPPRATRLKFLATVDWVIGTSQNALRDLPFCGDFTEKEVRILSLFDGFIKH